MFDPRRTWIVERDPSRWTDEQWLELVRLILEQEEDDAGDDDAEFVWAGRYSPSIEGPN